MALLFLAIGIMTSNPASSAPYEAVKIDPNKTLRHTVNEHMFGMNYEFNKYTNLKLTLADFDQMYKNSKFTFVRYPGGAAAERYFNLQNPDYYTDSNRITSSGKKVPAGRRLSEVISKRYDLAIVIPTIRYKNNPALGQAHAKQFVKKLLQGQYGVISKRTVIVFEIGNEFSFESGITAKEYGKLAAYMVKGIKEGINESGKSRTYRCRISVQTGQWKSGPKYNDVYDAAKEFAKYDKGKYANSVNYLSYHNYPWTVTNVLDIQSWRPRFRDELLEVRRIWKQYAKVDRCIFLSEYNNQRYTNGHKPVDLGLRATMTNMALFAEGLRGGVSMASSWNIFGTDNSTMGTSFYNKNKQLTFLGLYQKWMRENLFPAKLIEGVTYIKPNPTPLYGLGSENTFRKKRAYVEAFKKGNGDIVVFVHGQDYGAQWIDIKFDNFKISSVKGQRIYSTSSNVKDGSVSPKTHKFTPSLWDQNKAFSFRINIKSKYEAAMLIVKGSPSSSSKVAQETGVEDLANDLDVQVLVSPMPVHNGTINLRSNEALSEFHIISLHGGIIKVMKQNTQADENVRLDISDIPTGNYLLRCVTEDGRDIVQKLVVM